MHIDSSYICSSICIYGKTTSVAHLSVTCSIQTLLMLASKYKWKLRSGGCATSFYTSFVNCCYLHLAATCSPLPEYTWAWKSVGSARSSNVSAGQLNAGVLLQTFGAPLHAKACRTLMRGNTRFVSVSTPEEPEGLAVALKRAASASASTRCFQYVTAVSSEASPFVQKLPKRAGARPRRGLAPGIQVCAWFPAHDSMLGAGQ